MQRSVLCLLLICCTCNQAEITVSSQGTSGQILQLFDERNQKFQPYFFADSKYSDVNVINQAKGGGTFQSSIFQTLSEYVDDLRVEGEAKVDVVLRIVGGGLAAAGNFGTRDQSSSRTLKAVVEITKDKRVRKVNICDSFYKNLTNHDLLAGSLPATHVVVGIVYGLRLYIVIEISVSGSEYNRQLKQQIQAEVDHFFSTLTAKAEGKVTKVTANKTMLSNSKISVYCNMVSCPEAPQSFEQLESFISSAYEKLEEADLETDSDGYESYFILEELKSAKTCLRVEIPDITRHELSATNSEDIYHFIKSVEHDALELNQLANFVRNHRESMATDFYSHVQNVTAISNSFIITAKDELRQFVIDRRFGNKTQAEVSSKISALNRDTRKPMTLLEGVQVKFPIWFKKIEFYKSLMRDNIACLGGTSSLFKLSHDSHVSKILFFLYSNSTLSDNPLFLQSLNTFVRICNESKEVKCYVVDCYFEYSFCSNMTANPVLQFYKGNLTIVTNNLPHYMDETDVQNLRNAVLYLYVENAKLFKVLQLMDGKIEINNKQMTNVASILGVRRVPSRNISYMLQHDSFGRVKNNRVEMNYVETFLGRFVDTAQ